MKKNYIVPSTVIVNVKLHHIIAASPFNTNASGDVTGGKLQSEDAEGAALGRGGSSIWDDEE